MSDSRRQLPLVDVASVVVAPLLVMLMLGGLVFFLIEVLQGGKYEARLLYTFGFYVFGAVLVARISITQGRGKAMAYGLGLAGAAFVAMLAFVEYPKGLFQIVGPIINLGLIALVWWSASKLTWDCTHLDEMRKASGRGVLAAAGFDRTPSTTAADEGEYNPDRSTVATKKKGKKKAPTPSPVLGWWAKFQQFREWQKNKPHTPGVWVFYFALAALPLFALGQALIPADDTAHRSSTFWAMAIYVASSLGLLVTTTLMGLKRYLEDRNATIPTVLTGAWLGLGLMLILAFVGVAAVLPRPHSETPLFNVQAGGKLNRDASKNAVVKDNSAGKGEGAAGQRKESGDGQGNAKGGKPGGKGDGQAQGNGDNKGGNQSGGNKGDPKSGKDGSKGDGNKSDPKGDGKKGDEKKGDKNQSDGGSGDESKDKTDGDGQDNDGNEAKSESNPLEKLSESLGWVGEVIKWIVWAVLLLAVLIGGGYFLIKYMANFTGWAQGLLDWLRGLFGQKPKAKAVTKEEEAAAEVALLRPPPFGEFLNPFSDGTAKKRTARELAEYTFAAFDAWGWDHAEGRQPDETPTEYALRIGEDHPDLDEPGRAVADLYTRALFSKGDLPADAKTKLAAWWQAVEGVAV